MAKLTQEEITTLISTENESMPEGYEIQFEADEGRVIIEVTLYDTVNSAVVTSTRCPRVESPLRNRMRMLKNHIV